MIAAVPVSLWAADSSAAMLYARGTAWINGSTVPRSSAVFPGDLVQTKANSLANINAVGSSVIILADSLIKFEGPAVSLEHGGVTVTTSKGMTTRAGEVTVAPASTGWTEFEVRESGSGVQVTARKGDVTVSDGSATSTLSQGQQTTVSDPQARRKKPRNKGGAVPAAGGGILDSPIVVYGGAAAVGGLLTWVLIQGSQPISPDGP